MRIKLFILFLLVTFQLQAQYSETETLIQKKLKADLLTPDSLNGDGVYKVRHRKTGKWGMCQAYSSKKINLLIPLEYDDVLFFPPNGKFTAVFKDGKLGIYLSY